MIRKLSFCLLIFLFSGVAFAGSEPGRGDNLLTILKSKEAATKKRDLILYLRYTFGDMPEKDLDTAEKHTARLLYSFRESDSDGLIYFVHAICQLRQKNYSAAQSWLFKAIEKAYQNEDHYLLYACFTHAGFLQTDQGNVIAAISSFRAAKKEAAIVNDAYLNVIIDINLSNIYYKNAMYGQALFCLNEAQSLVNSHHVENQRTTNAIIYNKAELFFQSQNIDSLRKYNELLHRANGGAGLYTFQKRSDYYLVLLERKYLQAIKTITSLEKDSLYEFGITDRHCLADAYFQSGLTDSAKSIVQKLIKETDKQNNAALNLYFYKLLGDIEKRRENYRVAAGNYKMALSEAMEQLRRLTRVSSVSSQIRIDQIQNSYALKTESYKRERLWLILIISLISFIIVIGSLLYYNIHRKKYYEKLLFEAQKKEIAFINSHEVRRHSSNIMGIMQVIRHGENKHEVFTESEGYLVNELDSLDKAIRNISEKLNS